MNTIFGPRLLLLLAVLAPVILVLQPADVDAQTQSARPAQRASAHERKKKR